MSERASRAAAAKRAKERGGELYAQKRWDDAIGAFGEAIAVAPKDDEDVAVYHSNRAAAYLQRGDAASAKRAKADASVCVKARPHWARGWSRMATACEMLSDDVGAERAYEKLISLSPENADARKSLAALRKRMRDRPKRSSSGWRMPSMPSMPSMPTFEDATASAASVVSMARMRYDRMSPNGQLVVKCVLGVFVYYVLRFLARILGFGGYGYGGYGYDAYDDLGGGGFSLTTLIGVVALYYAHKSGASWWNLLSIANMFGLTGGGRRRGYGGYGRGYGRGYGGFGGPGMFF